MSYRINEPKPHAPHRTMEKTSTPYRLYVHNGQIAHIAIPCFYQEAHPPVPVHHHNRHVHDHIGWPGPNYLDRSCQLWDYANECCKVGHEICEPHRCRRFLDPRTLVPIHLREEGYDSVDVRISGTDSITKKAWSGTIEAIDAGIDDDEDWVIRCGFDIDLDNVSPNDDPIAVPFGVYASAPASGNLVKRRDTVCVAELIILPAYY